MSGRIGKMIKIISRTALLFLQDILKNEDFSLDAMFTSSLVSDLIKVRMLGSNCRCVKLADHWQTIGLGSSYMFVLLEDQQSNIFKWD